MSLAVSYLFFFLLLFILSVLCVDLLSNVIIRNDVYQSEKSFHQLITLCLSRIRQDSH